MADEAAANATGAIPDAPGDRVRAVIERTLDALDLDATVEIDENDETITARIDGDEDELGLVIGRHGQTIDALQLICYRAAFRGSGERKRGLLLPDFQRASAGDFDEIKLKLSNEWR